MSTRRLYLPAAGGVFPIWLFGGPNNGSIWLLASLPDDTIIILGADQYWLQAPGTYLAYGDGGKAYATSDPVIMPPSAVEAQAMALVVNPAGKVNSSLLGTFMSPNNPTGLLTPIGTVGGIDQYASLPTSMAFITILGVPHLLVGGLFSFYLKASHAYTAGGLAAIDLTTGLLNTGFTAGAITTNTGFGGTVVFPLKVYSDGGTNFGLYSIGNLDQVGIGPITNLLYWWTFTTALPSGAGAFSSLDGGSLTPPVGTYAGSNFNGGFPLDAAGAIGTPFPSGRFGLCPPCPTSTAGVFLQDSLIVRADPDPPAVGTAQASIISTTGTYTSRVFTVTILTGGSVGFVPTTIFGQGGTTGAQFTVSTVVIATMVAAIAALFPEATFTFVSTGSAPAVHVVITFTMPANSTYVPALNNGYVLHATSGWSRTNSGGLGGISATNLVLSETNSSAFEYIEEPQNEGGAVILSTALAYNAAHALNAYAWAQNGIQGSLEWSIKILGVIRINIGLTGASSGSFSGQNPVVNLTAACPVSVVAFKDGFAISLPYQPIFGAGGGSPGAPVTYQANAAVASAATVTLKCPIIVIDHTGAIDTAFDAALWTNFFSLARVDGARFGSMSLAIDPFGNLIFGSMYVPNYLDPALGPVTQSTALGDVTPVPVASPLTAGGTGLMAGTFSGAGAGLEVLCACDTTGAIVLPA